MEVEVKWKWKLCGSGLLMEVEVNEKLQWMALLGHHSAVIRNLFLQHPTVTWTNNSIILKCDRHDMRAHVLCTLSD